MAHDEADGGAGRAFGGQTKPGRLSQKPPIYGWWRPTWNLSFEGRVGIVANKVKVRNRMGGGWSDRPTNAAHIYDPHLHSISTRARARTRARSPQPGRPFTYPCTRSPGCHEATAGAPGASFRASGSATSRLSEPASSRSSLRIRLVARRSGWACELMRAASSG